MGPSSRLGKIALSGAPATTYIEPMPIDVHTLASGPGWCVRDVVCTAGPHDRPFEERHASVCVAAVAHGTFRYRSDQGAALLAPGAVLLGNHGHCFECGHEHGIGDRCVSVHFAPAQWDDVVAAVPGVRTARFALPRLPPLPSLEPLIAALVVACRERDAAELEELALAFAGAVVASQRGPGRIRRARSPRLERRISDAVRRIEHEAQGAAAARVSLAALAREAGLSPYHFLRVFRELVGMTPHQYVLRMRMHRAAVRLRRSDEPVSTIAFDAGFNDLSTFNRRFRRIMGASPSVYRSQRRAVLLPHSTAPRLLAQ
jgi:AraC family transcriptional regulator